MTKEVRTVRNRQSPGGTIQCNKPGCEGFISRHRFNNYLRFQLQPRCPTCGSDDLVVSSGSGYEIRNNRLVWSPRTKVIRKRVQGKNRYES